MNGAPTQWRCKMYQLLLTPLLGLAIAGNITRLEIKSSAFQNGAKIPAKYSGDSLNISPSLSWAGAPAGTKSFALICEDPDAPSGSFIHWVIFNIPKEKN